jgi:anti-sigma B factor antagonist
MPITTRSSGDVTILELPRLFTSDHGVDEFPETVRSLLQAGCRRFLVNMDVNYIDDAGINEIINAYKAVQGHGGTIRLLNPFKRIGPPLTVICKLLTVFDVYDDEAQAIASFVGDTA